MVQAFIETSDNIFEDNDSIAHHRWDMVFGLPPLPLTTIVVQVSSKGFFQKYYYVHVSLQEFVNCLCLLRNYNYHISGALLIDSQGPSEDILSSILKDA
jgi:hypothetical protein